MRDIDKAVTIQIDVTNACILSCSHCTRAVPHVAKPYFAELEVVEKALQSLEGWKRAVGCMGGEPTLHPQFPEICGLYRKYFPKKQRGLWTAGGKKYKEHEKLIDETFGLIVYNDHKTGSRHQPVLVASEDVVPDEALRNKLIDKCWLQTLWSPSITPKGAFFCEVAGTLDMLFDGPGGYEVEPDWWKRKVKDFQDQRDRACHSCSVAIPMKEYPDDLPYDYVSPSNLKRLEAAGSPMAKVVLDYVPGQGYVPASPRFANLYASDIAAHSVDAERAMPGEYGEWDETTKCGVLQVVLDYLYAGMPYYAWSELYRLYQYPDVHVFRAEIEQAVYGSPLFTPH